MELLKELNLEDCFTERTEKIEVDYQDLYNLEQSMLSRVHENERIRVMSMEIASKSNY